MLLDSYVASTVQVFTKDKGETLIGFVEDVVLVLFSEGKIKQLPFLILDGDDTEGNSGRVCILYLPVEDIRSLLTYPTAAQLESVMPEQVPEAFSEVMDTVNNLSQRIQAVPGEGGSDGQ